MVWSIFPPPSFAGTSEPAGRCCQASSIRFCGDVRKDLGPRSANDCHFQLGKCGSWRWNQWILWACLNPKSQVWTLALAMAHCDCEWHLAMAMACYGYDGKILNWKIKGLAKIVFVLLLLVSNHPKKSYDYVFENFLSICPNCPCFFWTEHHWGHFLRIPGGSLIWVAHSLQPPQRKLLLPGRAQASAESAAAGSHRAQAWEISRQKSGKMEDSPALFDGD